MQYFTILFQGNFGVVNKGKLTESSGNTIYVAVKHLTMKDDDAKTKEFSKEVEMLGNLEHENVVKFFGLCHESKFYHLIRSLSVTNSFFLKNYPFTNGYNSLKLQGHP